ncbi:hypothetical protein GCM10022254_59410 [Actinomadura meridiana]|uniref:Uncharacterized protein n=1 Tax=Actinomadura meridiana TaxID=559626 RepID=A0ABP8CI81_9ACTN
MAQKAVHGAARLVDGAGDAGQVRHIGKGICHGPTLCGGPQAWTCGYAGA